MISGIVWIEIFGYPVAYNEEVGRIHCPQINRSAVPRQALLLLSVLTLSIGACDPPAEEATPEAPAQEETEPETTEAADPVLAEAAELANSLQSRQLELAADLRSALDASDAAATGAVLAELGRSLAEMRGSTFDGTLVEAVRWFASAEMSGLRGAVDARRVIPALEVLLDVRDGAAVHRLRDSYGVGPGAERFQAAFSLSLSWSNAPSSLSYGDVGCPLLIDGTPAEASPVALTYGSHTLACDGGAVFLFVANAIAHQVTLQSSELRVEP